VYLKKKYTKKATLIKKENTNPYLIKDLCLYSVGHIDLTSNQTLELFEKLNREK